MLRILIKKQLQETFRAYFYDQKKNKMRPKGAIAAWFVFFFVIIIGVMGGMFTLLSVALCPALFEAGLPWLYYLILSTASVFFGAFGSVFSTFSALYLPKDNDLLFSLPIPVRTIITARLTNVYLIGLLYVSASMLPAITVPIIFNGTDAAGVICSIVLWLDVSLVVLILSCVLGWVVAKISVKLKNKGIVVVLISLLFIALYYFVYFKAHEIISSLISNASAIGSGIKGAAYIFYLFGKIGTGDLLCALVFTAAITAVMALLIALISRGFIKTASSASAVQKVKYKNKAVGAKSPFGSLLVKEFLKIKSSPNYMLNCAMGVILLPALAVGAIIKGPDLAVTINGMFNGVEGIVPAIYSVILCFGATLTATATPSVSLEGKNIWIPMSLPVSAKTVLRAKMSAQFILTYAGLVIASAVGAIIFPSGALLKTVSVILPFVFAYFFSGFCTIIGVRFSRMNWTVETVPIKQSGAVLITTLGGMAIAATPAGILLILSRFIGTEILISVFCVIFAALGIVMQRLVDVKGSRLFENL